MTQQFTASEVRAYTHKVGDGIPMLSDMLRAFADMLEAREKAVPVAWWNKRTGQILRPHELDAIPDAPHPHSYFKKGFVPLTAHSTQAQPPADQFDPERNVRPGDVGTEMQTAEQDAADFGTGFEVDGRRVAPERVRIFRGEQAGQLPSDADRLAEALRVFDGSFLKELADLVSFPEDDRGCINRSFVMERVVGLRRCWDKLSATRTHSAQAQPPAASVTDIDTMVNRFLSWRLPQDFAPDAGISFKPMPDEYMPHCWPTGTNLFHAGQAKEMILHMLAAQENPNG